jgi:peptidoglycan/xylan/chitin deacetylase (PgdA/CDA1 family)
MLTGAAIANRVGFFTTYGFLRRKFTKSQIAVLLYHRVCARNNDWDSDTMSPDQFKLQIEHFCNNYEIISLENLSQYIHEGKSLPEKAVVITFDDGYLDNFLYAFPILNKNKVPATIFLTTGHVATDKLFWWDKVGYLVNHSTTKQLHLNELGNYSLESAEDKTKARLIITEGLKKITEERKNLIIEKLLKISGVEIPQGLTKGLVLSWDNVREMDSNGINFGAHTVNHPILTNLPLQQAQWEIIQSKIDIEKGLGKGISAFSYPNGDYNDALARFVSENGFTCAVSVLPNRLIKPRDNIYAFGRILPENNDEFNAMFSGFYEDLKTILRRP